MVETGQMSRPVSALVRQCRVVTLRVAQGLERQHLHVLGANGSVSLVATVADIHSERVDEALRMVDSVDRVERGLGDLIVMRQQAVDLVDVEDCVGLEKRDYVFGFLPRSSCSVRVMVSA